MSKLQNVAKRTEMNILTYSTVLKLYNTEFILVFNLLETHMQNHVINIMKLKILTSFFLNF